MAHMGFPRGVADGWLWMLELYLDDTGTHAGSPVVGVGGLIGTQAQWTSFDAAWKALLREPVPGKPPIRKWSSHDCSHSVNEFAGYNEAERDLATFGFRKIITDSGLYSASNMIDAIAWKELVTARFGDKVGTAESIALFALIGRLFTWVSSHSEGPKVAIYYDVGRTADSEILRLTGLLEEYENIIGVSFLRVVDATPLQGADMIATEAFWYAKDQIQLGVTEPLRAHFRAYLKENFGRGNGMILDRAAIQRDAARRKEDGTLIVTSSSTFWRGQVDL